MSVRDDGYYEDDEDDGYGPDDDEEETRGLNDAENPESDF